MVVRVARAVDLATQLRDAAAAARAARAQGVDCLALHLGSASAQGLATGRTTLRSATLLGPVCELRRALDQFARVAVTCDADDEPTVVP